MPLPKHRKTTKCPFCGVINDAVSNLDGRTNAPFKGAASLCIQCGEWAIFDDVPDELRKPTDAEYDKIVASPACSRARLAWMLTVIERKK